MTQREGYNLDYISKTNSVNKDFFNSIISATLFGEDTKDLCTLRLIKNVRMYLDIMQQEMIMDRINGIVYGISHYYDLYCIKRLKQYLLCSGLRSSIVEALMDSFGISGSSVISGISDMIISGPNPYFEIGGSMAWQTFFEYEGSGVQGITPGVVPIIPVIPPPVYSYPTFTVSADATFVNVVPAGYMLLAVVFENHTVNWAQLSMGTTVGGSDIFGSAGINYYSTGSLGMTTVDVSKVLNPGGPTTIYLNHSLDGDTWNSAVLKVKLILYKT